MRISKLLISALLIAIVLPGCQGQNMSKTGTGALTGGALGAGLGAIIGHETGNTGAGIAIGAAAGLLGGGALGGVVEEQDRQIANREQGIARQEEVLQENRRLIEELRRRGADARGTERGVVVNLPDVLFEFGSAKLTGDAKRTAKDITEVLSGIGDRSIYVEGHTDSVGTLTYNQKLSEDRAWSVAHELVHDGIHRERVYVKGLGENDPIASNSTETGRRRNRRVEVIIGNN